jgi:hypothetical protein
LNWSYLFGVGVGVGVSFSRFLVVSIVAHSHPPTLAPPELEPGLRQRVVPLLGERVPLGEVGGVRRDLVRDDALLDVVAVGEAEVLFRRHVAEQRGAGGADGGGADGGRDVVVAGRDVGGERTFGVGLGLGSRF